VARISRWGDAWAVFATGNAPVATGLTRLEAGRMVDSLTRDGAFSRPVTFTAPSPLTVLSSAVPAIRRALATGDYDGALDSLAEAENAGRARKGVLRAIDARRD
jgi:hypothetical protein